ncbi:MAG: hypothetical protein KDI34_01325 [Halioglobus sp.]|nr:hypothetical protein [Halioglobus sp.]
MELDIRYTNHPEDLKHYTTEQLRSHFLLESVFVADRAARLNSHVDTNKSRISSGRVSGKIA